MASPWRVTEFVCENEGTPFAAKAARVGARKYVAFGLPTECRILLTYRHETMRAGSARESSKLAMNFFVTLCLRYSDFRYAIADDPKD
jgi:hypothetical protein